MSTRKHPRVALRRPVQFRHAQGQGEGILLDLSLGGCRIEGAFTGTVGTRVRLQLSLPDRAEALMIDHAVVRWVRGNQWGLSFLEVPSAVQNRLRQVFQLLHQAQHSDEPLT